MSNRQFIELYQYVVDLQNKKMKELNQNPVLLYAFDNIMDTINEANKNRKSIEYMVRDTMLRFEWFILLSLYAVIIVCVFEINDNSITSIGITILVSTVNMALIIIIRSLDEMMWKEEKWTWEPLTQFYEEIDLTPYVPEPCVREGRLILKKGKKYRVAEYPRPYPDMTGKTVKMIVG